MLAALLVATTLAAPWHAALAAYADDVGLARLREELGGAMPSGTGVAVSQVEGAVTIDGQSTWAPNPSDAEFAGKSIVELSGAPAGIYSGHASSVGRYFYGSVTSAAPGITSISAYWAGSWLGSGYLWATGVRRPASSPSRIVNHSWVADAGIYNAEVLQRLDWVIENDDQLHVAAMNNGSPGASASRALLGSSFNAIVVGRSDGSHETGSYPLDGIYVADRVRPDLVFPSGSTSQATPGVSSMAGLLVQVGYGNAGLTTDPVQVGYTNRAGLYIRNAQRAEVIKAALMAGADRITRNTASSNLLPYRDTAEHRSDNGLDRRYGAGQANVRNSYYIIASGEQNSTEDGGPGSGQQARGFDWDPAFGGGSGSNATATYPLPVSTVPQLLTATLAWNLDVNGGTQSSFNGSATLRDLALTVLDVSNASSPVAVWTSQGTLDNTENAWLVVPANGRYALRVTRASGAAFSYDYALAWQLLPDADGDGAHDGQDNCVQSANGPIIPDAGGKSQLDSDADGYGNLCDGDMDQRGGLVNAADLAVFRSTFGTASPNSDMDGSGGLVNAADLALFRARFGRLPGPSAWSP